MAVTRYESRGDAETQRLRDPLSFQFSKQTMKNRLFKASMGETLASWNLADPEACGIPTKELNELYQRVDQEHRWGEDENSFGAILTGNIQISSAVPHLPGDLLIDASYPFHGSRFDLSYAGRQALAGITLTTPFAPSVVPWGTEAQNALFAKTREATDADIQFLIDGFVHAATYLEAAGFDGVELHGAHGYVLAQFLSPRTNKRTDAYGGSLTNRMRLLVEIAKGIRAKTSPTFVVGVKLNSVEFQEGGFEAEEAAEVCRVLQDEAGMDFVELSGGALEKVGHEWTKETTLRREAFFLRFAELIVPRLGKMAEERRTKVFLTGGLRTAGAMVRALDTVDAVGIARPAAQEPWIARSLLSGSVAGVIKPVSPFDNDSALGLILAGAQLRQVGSGFKPLNSSDPKAIESFLEDKAAHEAAAAVDYGKQRPWFPVVSACDLCFLKKIKCDALKPTCSNCQIYKAECRTTKARNRISATRRQPREQAKPPSSPAPTARTNRIEDVESRLARVEHQLGLVFAAPSAAPVQAGDDQHKAAPAQDPDQFLSDFDYTALNEANQILGQPQSDMVPLGNAFTSKLPALDADIASGLVGDPYPCLPPLAEIQPAIADYFVHAAFMRMLQEYYASTCRQPRAAWAAVNVVLALATRVPVSPSSDLDLGFGDSQSVLSELVTRDVVLGLVIVFNALKDPSPAVVLVGTAVRLAHRLRLHNRRYQEQFPPAEILQRNRVFWITYLFDKDICLRHHTPSVQVDEDIDLDLPLEEPQDGAGNIYSKDGSRANFFRLRLRLAHIQGRITDQERRAQRWRLALPSDLQVDVVTELANRTALIWLCMMHFSYLGCLVMIHGIWTIPAHSRGTSEAEDASRLSPPLPRGWRNCVQMSRHCMAMMTQMPLSDCSVWANGCAYFSALIILQANLFDNTTHENVDKDLQLTKFAVNVIDQMSDASTIMQMKRMNVVAAELDRRVRLVVDHARQGVATSQPVPSVATVSPSETLNDHITYKDSDTELQWGWANDGVDAWPGLDVSIVSRHRRQNAMLIYILR
ncbi:hypothetical protein POJ06DRAFT_281740 [Lipomyces tetrasporus]|uniref:Zn(2)-C6 fungal-type domain-containing protein n=1 Tax=Lipomyces tetrasporus TaxID=54092 RepID=A0AAD7QST7_9ASCO|nr:uncharacterized protein POJ06DRAFT_281740 [Lipomyces tetrasporus]KAJ8100805.1 hypothetical protein POJ06DRAFT_281740 [Lipomyces tetrasporus]